MKFVSYFDELIVLASKKRDQLIGAAVQRRRWRRNLLFVSGILALITSGSLAAIAIKWIQADLITAMSATFAFISGAINIIVAAYFDDREMQKMYDGGGEFLTLREDVRTAGGRVSREKMDPSFELFMLENLRKRYVILSQQYDEIIPGGPKGGELRLISEQTVHVDRGMLATRR